MLNIMVKHQLIHCNTDMVLVKEDRNYLYYECPVCKCIITYLKPGLAINSALTQDKHEKNDPFKPN